MQEKIAITTMIVLAIFLAFQQQTLLLGASVGFLTAFWCGVNSKRITRNYFYPLLGIGTLIAVSLFILKVIIVGCSATC